ncbi:MFS transporter [Nocardioidaceae bacterium]|nr:MFS transporter [Nocardioidaceae bacterium]
MSSRATTAPPPESPERRAEQRAWYWYDWANSAYYTSVVTVLFAPYIIAVAGDAAEAAGTDRVSLLGLSVAPGALPSYLITMTTVLSAVLLPLLGPVVDRVVRKRLLLGGLAWTGAAFGSLLWFARDGNWQIGAIALVGANLAFAGSVVVQDSILPLISSTERRDAVSSRGWAFGYLGGGLLLALNLVVVTAHEAIGLTEGEAVRVGMLSAVVWWAGFTIIPVVRLRDHPPVELSERRRPSGGIVSQSFGQLAGTLRELPRYPMALLFLLAYLFFNDGIQTVIASASTYGAEELDFGQSVLIATILLVQFVAFAGALVFGRLAARIGAKHAILLGLAIWGGIVTAALVVPAGALVPFLVLAVAIGVVLGGCQALARSYFSVLIPVGKEAEYFAFYHAADRGTSWLGTLTFGVVFQITGSYRPAMFALIAFFGLGALLLSRVDTERGMRDAARSASAR